MDLLWLCEPRQASAGGAANAVGRVAASRLLPERWSNKVELRTYGFGGGWGRIMVKGMRNDAQPGACSRTAGFAFRR